MGQASSHLFAVEFDTVKNFEFRDIRNNDVGLVLNDLWSMNSTAAGYWNNISQFQELHLNSRQNIQACIYYDNLQNELKITIAEAGNDRPQKPLIYMRNISLSNIVEEEMYVGFSAATRLIFEENYILAWKFATNGTAPPVNTSNFPSFTHTKAKSSNSGQIAGISTACIVLILLAVAASVVRIKRNRYTEVIEEWEMEYWPYRFKYKDLHIATKGFRENFWGPEALVGRAKQLFIVYDYMPNGSLDKMIFKKPKKVLEWSHRYRVIRDVAAGLLYLHEEWEQCVVHRDIKSANVLLDSEMNGKLGDFGFSRLYEHNENSQATRVVGTLGKPVDISLESDLIVLLDWVRKLHAIGSLMDAANPNLLGQYVEVETERVLKLGLICSNPRPECRPGMKQVLQILDEEDPIPGFNFLSYLDTTVPESTWNSSPRYCSSSDASISKSN
ncbi:L-type lectin-domain containing receptor kinase SIT2-like [Cryptomeria japonica]|uniref:L-type lectin-domain containing receptor kinase SIT2-like n=1 Tax=Cryptomeria japonica TaxID=3369 RepID=UPI0027DA6CF5|nr:L-type lectin-domain containing receptor kinase SIT2-like [Cryptomeria japonica]